MTTKRNCKNVIITRDNYKLNSLTTYLASLRHTYAQILAVIVSHISYNSCIGYNSYNNLEIVLAIIATLIVIVSSISLLIILTIIAAFIIIATLT